MAFATEHVELVKGKACVLFERTATDRIKLKMLLI